MKTWFYIKTTKGEMVRDFGKEFGLVDCQPTMYETESEVLSEIRLAFNSLKSRNIIRELVYIPVKNYN